MKTKHWIIIAGSLILMGLISFSLNRLGILTLLDGLSQFNSYVYLIPLGGAIIYFIVVLSGQWLIKILMTIFTLIAAYVFFIVVLFESPNKTILPDAGIVVESRQFIFAGVDRFYLRQGLFYHEVFSCDTGEDAYCSYEITNDSLIITHGYYGGEEHIKIIPIKET